MSKGLGGAGGLRRARLPEVADDRLGRMPWVHRILLENLIRHAGIHPDADEALTRWTAGDADFELPFRPARMMMHDTTCVPALVDLAALRSVRAERGQDPGRINPLLRVDVSTDHSIAVDAFGHPGAMHLNMAAELRRNAERYRFMKWAGATFGDFHVHPPGTGIMHSMNLEQLATVVTDVELDGERWLIPDTLVGTDSHTPMVNGLGVLAWGVGGLEAESVMLGAPLMLRMPRVLGLRLGGALREGVTATDLALTVTAQARRRRSLRRVFRGRRLVPLGRRALRRRKHGPGIWRRDRLLRGRPLHACLSEANRTQLGACCAGRGLCPCRGALVRSHRGAVL